MKSYKVSVIDQMGKTLTETIPAEDEQSLLLEVKRQGYYLLNYEEIDGTRKVKGKLGINSLVVFTYQLSAMLSAGINIIDALRMIQNKALKENERRIYRNLYESVQKGNSLSAAMMDQDGAFDELLISMVKSGESSGSLDESLDTMAKQYERDKKINSKIKTASIYPIVLFIVSIMVVLILVTFVLPGIMESFPEAETPFLTRVLLVVSDFIIHKWYVLAIVLIAIVGGFIIALNNKKTRIFLHKQILKIPKIGDLFRTIYSARCARSFASLYSHGVNALEMIELSSSVIGNAYIEDHFDQVYVDVSRGGLISKAIDDIGVFDPMLASMINVGEETGDLESILNKTADYFDQEAESALTRLVSLVEPIMIVWMGIMVGLIVVSILQPMFKMYDHIGG